MTGAELRQIREARGESQAEFARTLGLTGKHSRQYIRKMEKDVEAVSARIELACLKLSRKNVHRRP